MSEIEITYAEIQTDRRRPVSAKAADDLCLYGNLGGRNQSPGQVGGPTIADEGEAWGFEAD